MLGHLGWAEALTLLNDGNVPDDVFAAAREQFSEEQLVNLTMAIVAINGANRINIAFRTVPGAYQPAAPSGNGTSVPGPTCILGRQQLRAENRSKSGDFPVRGGVFRRSRRSLLVTPRNTSG